MYLALMALIIVLISARRIAAVLSPLFRWIAGHLAHMTEPLAGVAQNIAGFTAHDRVLSLGETKTAWYPLVIIFVIASIVGLIFEQIWMFATEGLLELRVGLVWGPFSPLYGSGAVLLTLMCVGLSRLNAPTLVIFVVSAVVGGCLEQGTGWVMEHSFGVSSWTYAHLPDAISQWVAWRFLFIWGILGVIWCRVVLPPLLARIVSPATWRQIVCVGLIAAWLSLDFGVTLLCFQRKAARAEGIPPANPVEQWIDMHYDDAFISSRFQNLHSSDEDH